MSTPTIQNTAGGVSAIVSERLSQISKANGFETDCGTRIFRGRRKVEKEQVGTTGCILILEGRDIPEQQIGGRLAQVLLLQEYGIVAFVPIEGTEEPNDAAHRALRDMKKAIWKSDATFGQQVKEVRYQARDIGVREDGTNHVEVLLEIGVVFVESLITP